MRCATTGASMPHNFKGVVALSARVVSCRGVTAASKAATLVARGQHYCRQINDSDSRRRRNSSSSSSGC